MLRCESPIKCVALCDKFAAIGDQSGHVSIVDIEQHQLLYTSKLHEFPVLSVAFLGEELLSSGGDNHVGMTNRLTGTTQKFNTPHSHWISKVGTGRKCFFLTCSYDSTIILWEKMASSIAQLHRFEGHTYFAVDCRFVKHDAEFISISYDGTARKWSCETGKLLSTYVHGGGRINSFDISQEESILATCGFDGVVKLWDIIKNENIVCLPHTDSVRTCAFTSSGVLLTAGEDKTISYWENGSFHLSMEIKIHKDQINCVRVINLPNDGFIIISAGNDKTLQLIDNQGNVLHTLSLSSPVSALIYSSQYNQILYGCIDGCVGTLSITGMGT